MASLFSMDWTCCRCQHLNDSCTKCVCEHSYCHGCADALGCVARGSVTDHNHHHIAPHHNPFHHFTFPTSSGTSSPNVSPPAWTSAPSSSYYSPPTSHPSYPSHPPPPYSTPTSSQSSPTRPRSDMNRRPAAAIPHILPPQELVAPFATPRNSVSLTSLTTTITTNNPAPPQSRRRFFPSISVHDLGNRRRRSKSPQHRKSSSATPSIDEDFDKPAKVSRIDRWWIDL